MTGTYGEGEDLVGAFRNTAGYLQVVTDGPTATCPWCDYPERHRIYDPRTSELVADGCPSCEESRLEPKEHS